MTTTETEIQIQMTADYDFNPVCILQRDYANFFYAHQRDSVADIKYEA